MAKTISSSGSTGVTLTAAYDPLSVTSTGTISSASAEAIYGNASQAWHVGNAGVVQSTNAVAIDLRSASTVTNTGTISDTSSKSGLPGWGR